MKKSMEDKRAEELRKTWADELMERTYEVFDFDDAILLNDLFSLVLAKNKEIEDLLNEDFSKGCSDPLTEIEEQARAFRELVEKAKKEAMK